MLRSMMHRKPIRMRTESPFLALREDMERLFDQWMTDMPAETMPFRMTEETWFQPKVDIVQSEDAMWVKAELPGMEKKNIHLRVLRDQLILSGEKQAYEEQKELDYFRKERTFGSFRRELPLPVPVLEDKIEAKFKHGVLTVKLPKAPEARTATREIAID